MKYHNEPCRALNKKSGKRFYTECCTNEAFDSTKILLTSQRQGHLPRTMILKGFQEQRQSLTLTPALFHFTALLLTYMY